MTIEQAIDDLMDASRSIAEVAESESDEANRINAQNVADDCKQLAAWLRELAERRKEPGKAQLSQEDTTSDLISRTETAEHLRRVLGATVPITDYDDGFVDGVEFGISTVSTMPTIQPQSTTGQLNDGARSTVQSTDLINRQAALDIFDDYNVSVENGELEAYSRDRKRLCDLPPIQPVATDTNVGDATSRQVIIDRGGGT